jgi:SAM-dependent methyltransferase
LASASDAGKVPCNVRRFKENLFTLWRCAACGSLHCAEDADLPLYYAYYPLKDQRLTFHERIGYGNRLRLLGRQGFAPAHRILDYGCGTGLFVDFMRGRGLPQVFGYDAFVAAYDDPARLQETYDAVVSFDVIEHDDDPRAFMGRLSKLVRPGGLLVIGTPRADEVSIARHGDPQLHPPYHRHILSEKVLVALGRDHGMTPVHIRRRFYFDSLWPTVNSRFICRYLQKSGGFLDAAVEPPRVGLVWRSPDLIFFALFGYFLPRGDSMIVTFRKT